MNFNLKGDFKVEFTVYVGEMMTAVALKSFIFNDAYRNFAPHIP